MSIYAEGIYKKYGDIQALSDAALEVKPGEIFGLFGPNGAGKTTFVRVLTGLTNPDSGNARVCGVDVIACPNAVRRHTSILVEHPYFYEKMKLKNYLKFYAKLCNISSSQVDKKVAKAVEIVGMEKKIGIRLQTMSMGERQRAEIARVLIKSAEVLFLDEPFNGIDLEMRKKLRSYLKLLLEDGKCIFFTSHNLLEAEQIVDKFAIINQGKIIAVGTSQDLKDKYLMPKLFIRLKNPQKGLEILQGKAEYNQSEIDQEGICITLKRKDDIPNLIRFLAAQDLEIYEIKSLGTMEDVFSQVIKSPKEEVVT